MITAAELVEDRLSVVLASPGSAHAWHRLYHASAHLGPSDRLAVVNRIRSSLEFWNLAGVLAGTFLHALTDDVADLRRASRAFASSNLPLDAGLALLHTVYATALKSGSSDQAFHELVAESGFQEVSRTIGARLRDAGRMLPVSLASRAQSAGRLRVALVAPSLSSAFHAPTTMALQHARLLAAYGCDVSLFGAQEFQMLDMAQWLGVPRMMNLDHAEPAQWPTSRVEVPVVIAQRQLSCEVRWRQLLRGVSEFAPDVVFFVGPYSPLLEALHARYPVAGLGTNALAPIGPMDVWLAPEAVEDSSEPAAGRPDVDSGKAWGAFEVPHRIRYTHRFAFDESVSPMDRSSLHVPQDACVWVTVGTRLHTELTFAWVGEVRRVLDRNPCARWLLVGQEGQQLQGLGLDHPQILIRPFERRVQDLFKACDLYLNPPRRGGGHSVACAMFNGLAVLSMRTGDGGDKVGPWGATDSAEFFDRLHRLSTQQEEVRALARSMRQRFTQTFDMSRAGDFLLHAMQHACEYGTSRLH
jgi:hypothetical protein